MEDAPERALGGVLAWGRKHDISSLNLVVDSPEAGGILARRAEAFATPPSVWIVDGTALAPAVPVPPEAHGSSSAADSRLGEVIARAGAEPVFEHGVLRGEVLGLEVCRVVDGQLRVGVGKHDREMHLLMHSDRPAAEALADAVRSVREVRTADGPPHEMRRLAAERWLRAVVVGHPELVGCTRLEPVPPPLPQTDLRVATPAPAAGEDADGRPVLVVCSTGVDLDLVPSAADARLADVRDPRLVLVVPRADDHPVTRASIAALRRPAEVVTVPDDWRRL